MEEIELCEAVTALADDEIKDAAEKRKILGIIEENQDILFDYLVQVYVKSAVKNRVKRYNAPALLKENVAYKIKSDLKKPAKLTL